MPHVGITSNISLIFESKPFNFTITQAGLSFFSGLIGAFTGEIFAGPVMDLLVKRSTQEGKEWAPELRFRAVWLGLLMMPVSLHVIGSLRFLTDMNTPGRIGYLWNHDSIQDHMGSPSDRQWYL